MTTTGRDFIDHWEWAAGKGLMNANTANALRAACTKVLEVEKGWEQADVKGLEINSLLKRFQNLKGKEYKPESLKEYGRRFRKAHASYLEYLNDQGSWKPGIQERGSRSGRREGTKNSTQENLAAAQLSKAESMLAPKSVPSGFVEYPFPLGESRIVRLSLPVDLKSAEVKRLTAFMAALAVDTELAKTS